MRWALVGHFGFVSFGGYNIIGITGQLLDDSLVRELSPESRRLAEEIVRARTQYPGSSRPTSFLAMERMYNVTVWELAVPTARRLYADDTVAVNRALNDLSFEVLAHRPMGYVRWLCWNALHAVSESAKLLATNVAVLLTVAGVLLRACLAVAPRAHGATSAMHRQARRPDAFAKCTCCSGRDHILACQLRHWSCWWSQPSFATWSPGTCCCPRHWPALSHSTRKSDDCRLANDEHLVLGAESESRRAIRVTSGSLPFCLYGLSRPFGRIGRWQ